jgi:hypothetical protein
LLKDGTLNKWDTSLAMLEKFCNGYAIEFTK